MKIAIQGEPGSFSFEAAEKYSPQATVMPCAFSRDVFAALDEGRVEAAVVPMENTLAGSVSEHYDLLADRDLHVEAEIVLRIRHHLIALPGARREQIVRAFSHPVALAQCRRFFERNPGIEAAPFYDTAGSVKQVMERGDPSAAAIAGAPAAAYYGAAILEAGIEDDSENYTRFFVLRRGAAPEAGAVPAGHKISLQFRLENRPGTLVGALAALAAQGANLVRIESRPMRGRPWEYIFYVDLAAGAGGLSPSRPGGAGGDLSGADASRPGSSGPDFSRPDFSGLEAQCRGFRLLGCYPVLPAA